MLFKVPDVDPKEVSSSLLAYLGDGIMELYYRLRFAHLKNTSKISKKLREFVSKEGQAKILDSILDSLYEEEKGVVKRAMNSRSAKRYGNDPLYRKSTGLEALIGYLYLKGEMGRIEEILGGGTT